jgi:hypothetical protein
MGGNVVLSGVGFSKKILCFDIYFGGVIVKEV